MGYQTLSFVLFTFGGAAVYYIAGERNANAQRAVLLGLNLLFYLIAGAKYLPFLAASLLLSFFTARAIARQYAVKQQIANDEALEMPVKKLLKAQADKRAKLTMLFGVGSVLLLLAVCKYTPFALKNMNRLLSFFTAYQLPVFQTILPLGISFYSFMAVGYVLDVYWERYDAELSLADYALFLTYFPHIAQGPIARYGEMHDKFPGMQTIRFRSDRVVQGAELALWGFFKKLVIADRLCLFTDTVFDAPAHYTGAVIAVAAAVYSIQIYADFSGCIDIVSGASEIFGIELRKNFDHPYFSRSIPEFWRRWHSSLGDWFKDYVYFPVSVSHPVKKLKKSLRQRGRKKAADKIAACIPTAVVWAITGIWHGASWSFVAWGAYYAVLMVGGILLSDVFERLTQRLSIRTDRFSFRLFCMLRTFLLCSVGRIFFRAGGLINALTLFKGIFTGSPMKYFTGDAFFRLGLDKDGWYLALLSVLVLLAVDIWQEKKSLRQELSQQSIVFRWTVVFAGLFAVIILGVYGPGFDAGAFIYEQF